MRSSCHVNKLLRWKWARTACHPSSQRRRSPWSCWRRGWWQCGTLWWWSAGGDPPPHTTSAASGTQRPGEWRRWCRPRPEERLLKSVMTVLAVEILLCVGVYFVTDFNRRPPLIETETAHLKTHTHFSPQHPGSERCRPGSWLQGEPHPAVSGWWLHHWRLWLYL